MPGRRRSRDARAGARVGDRVECADHARRAPEHRARSSGACCWTRRGSRCRSCRTSCATTVARGRVRILATLKDALRDRIEDKLPARARARDDRDRSAGSRVAAGVGGAARSARRRRRGAASSSCPARRMPCRSAIPRRWRPRSSRWPGEWRRAGLRGKDGTTDCNCSSCNGFHAELAEKQLEDRERPRRDAGSMPTPKSFFWGCGWRGTVRPARATRPGQRFSASSAFSAASA